MAAAVRPLQNFVDAASVDADGDGETRPGSRLDPGDAMIRREVLGPVITVRRFSDGAQAIAWADHTPYGPASSACTPDMGRALRLAGALRFGCVWINDHIPLPGEMPHGGLEQSGHGKDLSTYAVEEYTEVEHVMASLA
jgi:betaine-aldehyde dehydrogenase